MVNIYCFSVLNNNESIEKRVGSETNTYDSKDDR